MGRAGEVKGVALRNFPEVLSKLRGADAWKRALDNLPTDLRHAFEGGGIIAGGWYPLSWYRDLHAAARRATGSEAGLAWQIGRESTRRDLAGVYKVFLRVLSPGFVLAGSSRFFGQYYRPGVMRLEESRPGFGRVTFTRCYGFNMDVWSDVFGGCEITMELAGAKGLRVRPEAGGRDGDTDSTLVAYWTAT
jgi:hypothetical protein